MSAATARVRAGTVRRRAAPRGGQLRLPVGIHLNQLGHRRGECPGSQVTDAVEGVSRQSLDLCFESVGRGHPLVRGELADLVEPRHHPEVVGLVAGQRPPPPPDQERVFRRSAAHIQPGFDTAVFQGVERLGHHGPLPAYDPRQGGLPALRGELPDEPGQRRVGQFPPGERLHRRPGRHPPGRQADQLRDHHRLVADRPARVEDGHDPVAETSGPALRREQFGLAPEQAGDIASVLNVVEFDVHRHRGERQPRPAARAGVERTRDLDRRLERPQRVGQLREFGRGREAVSGWILLPFPFRGEQGPGTRVVFRERRGGRLHQFRRVLVLRGQPGLPRRLKLGQPPARVGGVEFLGHPGQLLVATDPVILPAPEQSEQGQCEQPDHDQTDPPEPLPQRPAPRFSGRGSLHGWFAHRRFPGWFAVAPALRRGGRSAASRSGV